MNKRSFFQSIASAPVFFASAVPTLSLLLGAAGCSGQGNSGPDNSEPVVMEDTGALDLAWQLHEHTDPSVCDQSSAPTFQVTVTNSSGIVTTFQQDCRALTTTIALAPGAYTATAELLGANGSARTTSIVVNPFEIHAAVQLNITIDFPANSFE